MNLNPAVIGLFARNAPCPCNIPNQILMNSLDTQACRATNNLKAALTNYLLPWILWILSSVLIRLIDFSFYHSSFFPLLN
jgi:hypothetical protein